MQGEIEDDEANEVKGTVGKILKGAPGAPSGRPKSMREDFDYMKSNQHPMDRSDAHHTQASYHSQEAAKANKAGDKVAAGQHKNAARHHTNAGDAWERYNAKVRRGMNVTPPHEMSKVAHASTQNAETIDEKAVSKSQQRFFGMVDALKKGEKVKGATADMRKAAKDMSNKDVKDFARTKHKGLPNKVSEAVNVQAIKDEVMGAVRSGNPREMKRVDDTIAKRISDLMDLRGTAGKEVDAQITDALPVLKKAQMYLRDKTKMSEEAKKDACYNKVRSRYKVWPSAYASGALVQCRKKGAKNWGNKKK